MQPLNPTLREFARIAKILAKQRARRATRITTGPPDRRHHQVSRLECPHSFPYPDHLPKPLMAKHKILITLRSFPIFKSSDFFVGSTNPDFENPHQNLIWLANFRLRDINDLQAFGLWIDGYSFQSYEYLQRSPQSN